MKIDSTEKTEVLAVGNEIQKMHFKSLEEFRNYVDNNSVTVEDKEVGNAFQTALVKAKYSSQDGKITLNTMNVGDYATQNNMTEKEIEVAEQLDQSRISGKNTPGFYDALYNETDADKVRQTIHNLARYSGPRVGMGEMYGSIVSGFCPMQLGGGLTGVHQRGQSLDEEISAVDQAVNDRQSQSVFNQSNTSSDQKRTVWASFSHTSINGYGYEDDGDGIIYDGYDVRRSGIIGGVRKVIDDTLSGGLFFAYSDSDVTQCGIYEGGLGNNSGSAGSYNTGMDNSDFQFALHFEKVFADFWETAFYIGGGTYSTDWNRNVYDETVRTNQLHKFTGETTGNTLTGTAYLACRLEMTDSWTLRPTIGIDSEHCWLFGFDENRTAGTYDIDSLLGSSQKYHYNTIQYSRNTARVGLASSWTGSQGRGGLTGRVFYGVQLGGKYAPTADYQSLEGNNDAYCDIASHEMGGESINLGLGGYHYLNRAKTLSATADINGIWYKNASTQNVTAGINWRF